MFTYDSHRRGNITAEEGSSCLMTGSQDNRGNVCFNGFSGWLVLDVKDVKHGFIGARMEAWGGTGADGATEGWTEVNNGGRGNYDKSGRDRRLHEEYQERWAAMTECLVLDPLDGWNGYEPSSSIVVF